jgi:hypothetical protein
MRTEGFEIPDFAQWYHVKTLKKEESVEGKIEEIAENLGACKGWYRTGGRGGLLFSSSVDSNRRWGEVSTCEAKPDCRARAGAYTVFPRARARAHQIMLYTPLPLLRHDALFSRFFFFLFEPRGSFNLLCALRSHGSGPAGHLAPIVRFMVRHSYREGRTRTGCSACACHYPRGHWSLSTCWHEPRGPAFSAVRAWRVRFSHSGSCPHGLHLHEGLQLG